MVETQPEMLVGSDPEGLSARRWAAGKMLRQENEGLEVYARGIALTVVSLRTTVTGTGCRARGAGR